VVVTAGRSRPTPALQAEEAPAYASDKTTEEAAVAPGPAQLSASRRASDAGASLRAAAAAGRTAEVEDLLDQGAAVDAADAAGDTALMKTVRAGHADVAALLRRHGASPDRRNHAGESAREMAAAKHDPALDQALGPQP
jgi:ankyrin repeat protein